MATPTTIICVDDSPSFLELTVMSLKQKDEQFDIRSTTAPEEVLSQIERSAPDCIVSDLDMNGMSGFDLYERVQEAHDIPFVLFTSHTEVRDRAIDLGVDGFFSKNNVPAVYGEISETIEEVAREEPSLTSSRA